MQNVLKYPIDTYKIALVKDRAAGAKKLKIGTLDNAAEWLEPLRHRAEEVFVSVLLNSQHEPIGVIEVSHGTVSSSLVHPREVFKSAILANASAILVAHNHPGGSLKASLEDLECTKQLLAAAKVLGIKILDHLILTADSETSIRETNGYLWD
jgi:DNA repair protein RadC